MGGFGLADTTKFQSEVDGGYATTARRLPHESRTWHFRRQLRASGFDVLVRNIDLVLALAVTAVATGVIRDGGAGQRVIDVLQLLVELDLGNRGLGVLERAFGIPELIRDGGDIDIECLQLAGDVLQRGARHTQFDIEFCQCLGQDKLALGSRHRFTGGQGLGGDALLQFADTFLQLGNEVGVLLAIGLKGVATTTQFEDGCACARQLVRTFEDVTQIAELGFERAELALHVASAVLGCAGSNLRTAFLFRDGKLVAALLQFEGVFRLGFGIGLRFVGCGLRFLELLLGLGELGLDAFVVAGGGLLAEGVEFQGRGAPVVLNQEWVRNSAG